MKEKTPNLVVEAIRHHVARKENACDKNKGERRSRHAPGAKRPFRHRVRFDRGSPSHAGASGEQHHTVFLFWRIGQQVNSEILHHQRAEYGQKIVTTLATQLVASAKRPPANSASANCVG